MGRKISEEQTEQEPGFRKLAWEAAHHLVKAYGDTTARSWFLGTNDLLNCESPAWVLRHGHAAKDWEYVVPAARAAVENSR